VRVLDSFSLHFFVEIFNKCFTMDKWVIREPIAKTCEGDSGEPKTSDSGHLTSEDVSAYTSATSTTEESDTSVRSVRAGKFTSGKKRKYQETYLEHGFTYSTIDGGQHLQCLICSQILANDSMKPVKLERNLATKHAEFKNEPIEFLRGN
jgi:hypothetical protein